jgi:hypothetical protein
MSIHDPVEADIAMKLVLAAIVRGYMISVHEGEDWAIKRSVNPGAILDAMGSTDEDQLLFRDAKSDLIGSVWLIYGNGEDVISDCTANDQMDHLVGEATAHLDNPERAKFESKITP